MHPPSNPKPEEGGGGGGCWGIPFCWLWLNYQDIKERRDEDLLVLPTDAVLFEDPSFKVKQNEVWLWGSYIA
jgi:L-ascorbate peroxidase